MLMYVDAWCMFSILFSISECVHPNFVYAYVHFAEHLHVSSSLMLMHQFGASEMVNIWVSKVLLEIPQGSGMI